MVLEIWYVCFDFMEKIAKQIEFALSCTYSVFTYFKSRYIFQDVAMQHPEIEEIGVYGIPDENVQELVSAVVVKKEASKLTERDVVTFVNEKLEDFKHFRGIVKFVKSIPRNPQGKVVRSKLID